MAFFHVCLGPQYLEVQDQFACLFGSVGLRDDERLQFHLLKPLLPVVFLIREDAVDASLGHTAELFPRGVSLLLHPIDFVLETDDSEDFLEPPWAEFDRCHESADLIIGDLAGDVAAAGRVRGEAS